MDNNTMIIMGFAVAANIIIIMWKLKKERISDGVLDFGILLILAYIFKGTISGLMVGTVASCIVSIYLVFNPPKEYLAFALKKFNKKG